MIKAEPSLKQRQQLYAYRVDRHNREWPNISKSRMDIDKNGVVTRTLAINPRPMSPFYYITSSPS